MERLTEITELFGVSDLTIEQCQASIDQLDGDVVVSSVVPEEVTLRALLTSLRDLQGEGEQVDVVHVLPLKRIVAFLLCAIKTARDPNGSFSIIVVIHGVIA